MWICFLWEHSWNEIRLKTRSSLHFLGCHYLTQGLGTFLKQQPMGMQSIFLTGWTEPRPVLLPSPLPSRWGGPFCADHLCLGRLQRTRTRFPSIKQFPAGGLHLSSLSSSSLTPSSLWVSLTLCSVGWGANLDSSHTAPSSSQTKRVCVCVYEYRNLNFSFFLTSCLWCSCQTVLLLTVLI